MRGALLQIKQLGFLPNTVIDVGAALGTFELYETFPRSRHLLIEPIIENKPFLEKICSKLANADYLIAAATHQSGTATLKIASELVHSSATFDASSVNDDSTIVREVRAVTLDQLCQEYQLEPPYLLKIDVDGNEVDVLTGAKQMLQQTEYVIVEVSLFGQIHQVINFMASQGFAIYDVVDLACRRIDSALWQADMAFVKESGQFKQNRAYLPPEQTELLSQSLQNYRASYMARIEERYSASDESAFIAQLELRQINLIAFPNWQQSEENLLADLSFVLQKILVHPAAEQIKLLIDSTGADLETANLVVSTAAMPLLSELELDNIQQPSIALLADLTMPQWQCLLPKLTGRIQLACDDKLTISLADAQNLNLYDIDSF